MLPESPLIKNKPTGKINVTRESRITLKGHMAILEVIGILHTEISVFYHVPIEFPERMDGLSEDFDG